MNSTVKRYDPDVSRRGDAYMDSKPDGDYVHHDDYAALEAENARLHAMLADWEADANLLEKERNDARRELRMIKAQGPVAWFTEDCLDDKSATTYRKEVAERWRSKGWPVWPLYAHPAAPSEGSEK